MDEDRPVIVIPAWNEAEKIGEVVRSILPFGRVLVVDDRSSDETAKIASEAGAWVVRLERNRGYDGALDAGFAAAGAFAPRWIVTMDADGAHDPGRIPAFVAMLESGSHVVVGERPRRQRWSESVFGVVGRWRWGVPDPLCGMKGYRFSVVERFGRFDRHASIGTDLMVRAARSGLAVSSLPVPCRPRENGPSRFGGGWSANRRILRAMWLAMVVPVDREVGRSGDVPPALPPGACGSASP